MKDNAVLKDANGNIGYWALYKTVDTNKNYIQYTYDNNNSSHPAGTTAAGAQEIYPKTIEYTLHETNNPPQRYSIEFETLGGRKDIQIDGRLGFLKATSKKLTDIKIIYGSDTIRSYKFKYKDGAFNKTLLQSIQELDADGADFYTNTIEYEAAPAPNEMFADAQDWTVSENVNLSDDLNLSKNYSMLSGGSATSIGANFALSVGLFTVGSESMINFRKGTFGAHGSGNKSDSDVKITLIDIDGDNLPDRVYEKNGKVYYSKNKSKPGGLQEFAPSFEVAGDISTIGKTSTLSWGVGIDGNYSGAGLGFDYSNSTSTTKSYFMDFNNDGLVDFVKDGKVYFNRIVNGVPSFQEDSGNTPYPIKVTSSTASQSLFDSEDKAEKKMMLEQNPLHDIVRVWVAPKSGTISVNNKFKIKQIGCPEGEDCSKADGVAVSFQYKSNDPLVDNINAGDYTQHSFPQQAINISKGEKLYFRITSKYDGTKDQVEWNPEIIYSAPNVPAVDSDNRNLSVYRSAEDFVNSNGSVFYATSEGTLSLYLNKPIALSDDARIKLSVNDNDIPLSPVAHNSTYNNTVLGTPITLHQNDKVQIKVETDTQIDWSNFKLTPVFVDSAGKKTDLQVEYSMYNDRGNFANYKITAGDVNKKILVRQSLPQYMHQKNGKIIISAKIKNKLLTKTVYTVTGNGSVVTPSYSAPYTITANDVNNDIYLETTVSSHDSREFITDTSIIHGVLRRSELNGDNEITIKNFETITHKPILSPTDPTQVLNSNQYDSRFGMLYRGWGAFVLNGNNKNKNTVQEAYSLDTNYANKGTVSEMKIIESALALSNAYGTDQGENPTVNEPRIDENEGTVTMQDNASSLSNNYFLMTGSDVNNEDKGRWPGTDPAVYISKELMSASRLGVHSVDTNFQNSSTGQNVGDKLNAPSIKLKTQNVSVAGKYSFEGVSIAGEANASKTLFSEAKSVRNVLDYNGDGFPDDFNKKNLKLTSPLGGPSGLDQDSFGVKNHQSISSADAYGVSTGINFTEGKPATKSYVKTNGTGAATVRSVVQKASAAGAESKEASKKLSLSGDIGFSGEKSKKTFIDINGDGLPDVYNKGKFSLNVGRNEFAGSASWNVDEVSKSKSFSTSGGAGGGISLFWGSFEGGVNVSSSESETQEELLDINGDGLPDRVDYNSTKATIYINNGNGIDSKGTNVLSGSGFHVDKSTNIGGGIGATIPIFIFTGSTTGFKLAIKAGVSKGTSYSRTKSTFKDMNGDGYPDFVTSDDANNIKVSLNQIGTTNLLKKVTTPLGGSWEVAYERVGNTYDMPQSKYVMKSVVTNDGFTGDNSFSTDVSKVTVSYEKPYHSRWERTFYGFEKVVVNQIDTKQGGAASNVVFRKTILVHDKNIIY